jgi:hypothetical protein
LIWVVDPAGTSTIFVHWGTTLWAWTVLPAWIITIPATAAIAALFYGLASLFG